jgi:hypothetical protein
VWLVGQVTASGSAEAGFDEQGTLEGGAATGLRAAHECCTR